MDNQPSESKPEKERLEAWLAEERKKGLVDVKLFRTPEWNLATEEERAKSIMDMIEAPVIPMDPDLL